MKRKPLKTETNEINETKATHATNETHKARETDEKDLDKAKPKLVDSQHQIWQRALLSLWN